MTLILLSLLEASPPILLSLLELLSPPILLILLDVSPKLKKLKLLFLLSKQGDSAKVLQTLLFLDMKLVDYFLSSLKNIILSFKKLLLLLSYKSFKALLLSSFMLFMFN